MKELDEANLAMLRALGDHIAGSESARAVVVSIDIKTGLQIEAGLISTAWSPAELLTAAAIVTRAAAEADPSHCPICAEQVAFAKQIHLLIVNSFGRETRH